MCFAYSMRTVLIASLHCKNISDVTDVHICFQFISVQYISYICTICFIIVTRWTAKMTFWQDPQFIID